jgi:hypothetical protein
MKVLVASVLMAGSLGGCIYGKSSDPVYFVTWEYWKIATNECVEQGGLGFVGVYEDTKEPLRAICKTDIGNVSKPLYTINQDQWSLANGKCKSYGTVFQIEISEHPHLSMMVVCKSGAVFRLK